MCAKSFRWIFILALLALLDSGPSRGLAVLAAAPGSAPLLQRSAISQALAPAGRNCGDVFWADRWMDYLPAGAAASLITSLAAAGQQPAAGDFAGPDQATAEGSLYGQGRITWTTDQDFLPGFFSRTEAPEGLGRITLARLWQPAGRVDDDLGEARQDQPKLAISPDGRTIYAVWRDERNGQSDICSCSSSDGGRTWSKNTKVNDDAQAPQGQPSLAVAPNGQLFAAWVDGRHGGRDIFAARSRNGGVDWEDNIQVNDPNSTPYDQDQPSLAAGRDFVYVAWRDFRNGNADIFFARSAEGYLWSEDKQVNDDPSGRAQANPNLVVDEKEQLYLAWSDDRNGNAKKPDPDIYFAHSPDQGASWSQNVRVNDDASAAAQDHPDLAAGKEGEVFLAWQDFRNNKPNQEDPDIYFARSENAGQDWSRNSRVNEDPPGAIQDFPSLAAMEGGRLFLAWQDGRHGAAKAPDFAIYFARSANAGETWMVQDRIDESDQAANQQTPSLAVYDGEAFAIWHDARNDAGDIWSSRWPRLNAFAPSGSYASPVFDAINVARWDELSWIEDLGPGGILTMTVRAGDSPLPSQGWTDWIVLGSSPASLDNLPPRQFFQWGIRMFSKDPNLTPSLEQVTLAYSACYDFDGSGRVTLADVQRVAGRFGWNQGQPGFDPRFDVDRNGVIDVIDLIWVAGQWGEVCP